MASLPLVSVLCKKLGSREIVFEEEDVVDLWGEEGELLLRWSESTAIKAIRAHVQFLCNFMGGNETNQKYTWEKCFPSVFMWVVGGC